MKRENIKVLPFLKWVGGKRTILDEIRVRLPSSFNDYYEPFIGGGSVFFGLGDVIQKAYLSDVNRELVNSYNAVKLHPYELIEEIKKYQNYHCKAFYYHVRDSLLCKGVVEKAFRFMYLNRAGFRGMYRLNSKGKFNVPFGYTPTKSILLQDRIISCSKALEGVTITRCSFDKTKPKKKDFIFLDPPYHKEEKMFTEYIKGGFSQKDQEHVYKYFKTLDRKGAYLMLTNSDTPFIHNLYKDYSINRIPVNRKIANGYANNTSAYDLIIRNYE